jgi:protein subunit release factor B
MVNLPLARLLVDLGAGHGHLLHFDVRDGQIDLSLVPLDTEEELAAEATPPAPEPDRRLETDIAAVMRSLRELRERIDAEEADPVVLRLRREVSALLTRTREPTFWDDPAAAREVLSRVYHLERALKRLDSLAERAGYLEEKGRQIRIHRDRRGVPELARDVERLAGEFAYLQMELAGAGAGTGHDQALLRVTPLGRESEEWAGQLLEMYAAWAARKGYEYELLDPAEPPDGADRRRPPPAPSALYVRGSNIYEFLRGEAGLHKLSSGAAEDRQRTLARVTVLRVLDPPPEDDPQQRHAALARLLGGGAEGADRRGDRAAVVRTYSQGRHRFVRDARTGVRLTDVTAVLQEGQIDAFLLASLRQSAGDKVTR